MANRTITVQSNTLLTALGGTVNAGDDVYIDRYANDFTDGVLSAADVASCNLTAGFSGTLTGAGQLKVVADRTSTGFVRNQSNASRIELVSTSGAGVVYNIHNNPVGNGLLVVNTLDCENLVQQAGTCSIESVGDVNNVYCQGGVLLGKTASLTAAILSVSGGSCIWQRDFTNGYVKGNASLTLDDTSCSPSGALLVDGGTLKVKAAGTIANLNGESGVIDFRELRTPLTISAAALWPGIAILHSVSSLALVTWTSIAGYRFGGPKFITN